MAERVIFMHQGRVHEIGPPAELFGAPRTSELRQFLSSLNDELRAGQGPAPGVDGRLWGLAVKSRCRPGAAARDGRLSSSLIYRAPHAQKLRTPVFRLSPVRVFRTEAH